MVKSMECAICICLLVLFQQFTKEAW